MKHILIDCPILTTHINNLHKALGRKVHGFPNMSKEEKVCKILEYCASDAETGKLVYDLICAQAILA